MVAIAILALFQILLSYLFFVQKMIYMVIFKKNTLFLMVIAVYVYFFQLTSEVGKFLPWYNSTICRRILQW